MGCYCIYIHYSASLYTYACFYKVVRHSKKLVQQKTIKIHYTYIQKNIKYVDHDYVLDKIMWRYQIQFYRKINIDNKSYYTNE